MDKEEIITQGWLTKFKKEWNEVTTEIMSHSKSVVKKEYKKEKYVKTSSGVTCLGKGGFPKYANREICSRVGGESSPVVK